MPVKKSKQKALIRIIAGDVCKHTYWYAAVGIVIVIFGTIYGAVQQSQRNDADMPQVQLAEDAATQLNEQYSPAALSSGRIDIATSLDPFTVIYSQTGSPIAGSGYLDNSLPTIPFGVLQASNNKMYHRVTWQPESNVRIAAVVVQTNKYYVLSGRSMILVEQNELRTLQVTACGCLMSLIILCGTYLITKKHDKQ